MKIKNVILDFGHGGLDSNGNYTTAPSKMFIYPNGEIAYEGVLNRQIGGFLYTYLRNHTNLNVVCTVREDDPRDLSLSHRVRVANQFSKEDSIFVSIHCNAGGGRGSGFEIFTSIGQTKSDELAENIATEVEDLYDELSLKLRYDFSDGDKDKEADFYVLRKTKGVAVLIECGFFDNPNDFELLKDPKFQSKLAYKIYEGIISFIDKKQQ